MCFPVNIPTFLKNFILENIYKWLLLCVAQVFCNHRILKNNLLKPFFTLVKAIKIKLIHIQALRLTLKNSRQLVKCVQIEQ